MAKSVLLLAILCLVAFHGALASSDSGGESGCSLCGEGESVPEAAKGVIVYDCSDPVVEGFEGSTEAECEAAGGGSFSSYTCGELETYLRKHSSTNETCYSHQEQFKLKCSCPLIGEDCGGCPASVHFSITYNWISQFAG